MSLADRQGNQTIVRRLERQQERVDFYLGFLDDTTLNRKQRRALRKATIARTSSKRDVKKAYKDEGREEHLERLVKFYGPALFFKRTALWCIRFGKSTKSDWPLQELNDDEARRLKKILKPTRKRVRR